MRKKKILVFSMLTLLSIPLYGQDGSKKAKADNQTSEEKAKTGEAANLMLNAKDESEPRFINVGLPQGSGGTVVSENGLLVTTDVTAVRTVSVWRQDGSFKRPSAVSFAETAMKLGAIGVSMATDTRQGSDKFIGRLNIGTSMFGKINGNLSLAGPLGKGWYYHANIFTNNDPGSTRPSWTRFLDETLLLKGLLTKKYNKGEINLQYKYISSKKINDDFAPYNFHSGKQVTEYPNFRLGKDSYLSNQGTFHWTNPLTGDSYDEDILDVTRSYTHSIDLFGKNKLPKGLTLDWGIRYQHAMIGFANFALNQVNDDAVNPDKLTPLDKESGTFNNGKNRWVYADANAMTNHPCIYQDKAQQLLMGISPRTPFDLVTARLELSKNGKSMDWKVGYMGYMDHVKDYVQSSYVSFLAIEPNPSNLIFQVKQADGTWKSTDDKYGQRNVNASYLYYTGTEWKNAIWGLVTLKPMKQLKVELGARLELHNYSGYHCPSDLRGNSSVKNTITEDTKAKFDKSFFNKSFSISARYNILNNFGVMGDIHRLEVSDGMTAFKSANRESEEKGGYQVKQNVIPYFAGGVFYNTKWVNVISRLSYISRSNIVQQGNFQYNDIEHAAFKQSFTYDVETLGWTTDAIIRPFKGFELHLLLTLQNPKHKKFEFDLLPDQGKLTQTGFESGKYGAAQVGDIVTAKESYNYTGKIARVVSKTIIEIDPSYAFDKFRIWASFRYFSKQSCVMPGTMFFPARWETFAGVDYQATKKVSFALSANNLFQQVGAQGRIIGTNTLLDKDVPSWDGRTVAGTYIRPFGIDLKMKIQF